MEKQIKWRRSALKNGWIGVAIIGKTHYLFNARLLPDVKGEGCASAELVRTNSHYEDALRLRVRSRSLRAVKQICEAFVEAS